MTMMPTPEHTDLLAALAKHRELFRQTVTGLTDEQARLRATASELCLGGLVKHVSQMEQRWIDFVLDGPSAIGGMDESSYARQGTRRASGWSPARVSPSCSLPTRRSPAGWSRW